MKQYPTVKSAHSGAVKESVNYYANCTFNNTGNAGSYFFFIKLPANDTQVHNYPYRFDYTFLLDDYEGRRVIKNLKRRV